MRFIFFIFLIAITLGCTSKNVKPEKIIGVTNNELIDFASANCFFWYFKKKGYDTEDIASIAGGIVEMGTYSANKFQQVALLVKGYSPAIKTKNNIDVDLLKCFELDTDQDFIQSVDKLK